MIWQKRRFRETEIMDIKESLDLLELLKATKLGFFIEPKRAARSWQRSLCYYSNAEVLAALDYFESTTDEPPTALKLKNICIKKRQERDRQNKQYQDYQFETDAAKSFVDVPGKNRVEKVVYVQAERAAQHYNNGEIDNEFFNDLLLKGQVLGFEFDGVDYDNLIGSGQAWKSLSGLGMI